MPKNSKSSEPETAATAEPAVKAPAKVARVVKAPKPVEAVFVPVGQVKVHLKAPSGNEYDLVPRKVFTIAAADVDWFFHDWEWCFRQRLVRAEEYKPQCGYHDSKAGCSTAKAEADSRDKE